MLNLASQKELRGYSVDVQPPKQCIGATSKVGTVQRVQTCTDTPKIDSVQPVTPTCKSKHYRRILNGRRIIRLGLLDLKSVCRKTKGREALETK